jgi:hypothetical protein
MPKDYHGINPPLASRYGPSTLGDALTRNLLRVAISQYRKAMLYAMPSKLASQCLDYLQSNNALTGKKHVPASYLHFKARQGDCVRYIFAIALSVQNLQGTKTSVKAFCAQSNGRSRNQSGNKSIKLLTNHHWVPCHLSKKWSKGRLSTYTRLMQ